jgi:CubicO group peptidase (beta-lactamase class C family)
LPGALILFVDNYYFYRVNKGIIMKILSAVLLYLFFFQPLYAQPQFVKDSLDIHINNALKMWDIPGAAVCIVKDGRVVVAKGYGYKESGLDEKVDANTLFMIGSNTKAFTGTLLALLEAEGRLDLEDKVQKFLPHFSMKDPWVAQELNLIDIVTHRMGMETFQGDAMYWTSDLTMDEVIEKFGRLTPRYSFRTRYGYTNAGYAIAAEVIRSVTDTVWSELVKEKIFKPLRMERTLALSQEYFKADNIARAHTYINNKMEVIPFKNIDNLAPAGSIGSSVNDLSKWMITLLDSGRSEGAAVIPFRVIQRTRQPFTIEGRARHPFNRRHYSLYGLGWVLEDYEGKEIVSHTGGVNGFVTSVTLIPEDKLGIAILTNNDQNHFYVSLKWELVDSYIGLGYRDYNRFFYDRYKIIQERRNKEIAELQDSAAMKLIPEAGFEKFTGRYEHEVYGFAEIVVKEGFLEMSFEHHSGLTGKLEYLGNDRFLCTFSDPAYGIMVIPFGVKEKVESFTLRVDPFIEFTTYEFIKN